MELQHPACQSVTRAADAAAPASSSASSSSFAPPPVFNANSLPVLLNLGYFLALAAARRRRRRKRRPKVNQPTSAVVRARRRRRRSRPKVSGSKGKPSIAVTLCWRQLHEEEPAAAAPVVRQMLCQRDAIFARAASANLQFVRPSARLFLHLLLSSPLLGPAPLLFSLHSARASPK